jgi:hypothetical protein
MHGTMNLKSWGSSCFGTDVAHVTFVEDGLDFEYFSFHVDPSTRAVYGMSLRLQCSWDCGFKSRRGHGWLSVLSVVCCQVEFSATIWSLVQRSPTDCGLCLSVIVKPRHEEALAQYGLSSYAKELHFTAVNFKSTDVPYSSAINCWHRGPSEAAVSRDCHISGIT